MVRVSKRIHRATRKEHCGKVAVMAVPDGPHDAPPWDAKSHGVGMGTELAKSARRHGILRNGRHEEDVREDAGTPGVSGSHW